MILDDPFAVVCTDFREDLVSIRYFPLIMHRPGGTSGCESLSRSCIPIVFIFSVGLVFRVWVPAPKILVSSLFAPHVPDRLQPSHFSSALPILTARYTKHGLCLVCVMLEIVATLTIN